MANKIPKVFSLSLLTQNELSLVNGGKNLVIENFLKTILNMFTLLIADMQKESQKGINVYD